MDEKVKAVQKMQDYIQNHLHEEISLADLAKEAGFSPWYAARLFKELTEYSPAEYIRRLKLSESALRLRDENVKIIDVAFDMGFGSVDGYQRAFLREFGCNPKEYSSKPIPIPLFTVYGVKFMALWKENDNMSMTTNVFIQVIKKEARKVIVKRGKKAAEYMAYCYEVGNDVWGTLTSMKDVLGEPVGLWLPKRYIKDGTSEYVQGVEVSNNYSGVIPEGFDIIELPKAKYLVFQGEPFDEEQYCDAIYAVQNSMTKYNPEVIGLKWDDENPRVQLEPRGVRGYIEMRAVVEIKK